MPNVDETNSAGHLGLGLAWPFMALLGISADYVTERTRVGQHGPTSPCTLQLPALLAPKMGLIYDARLTGPPCYFSSDPVSSVP